MKLKPSFFLSLIAAAALLAALPEISSACDTWVALPDATADGSIILAKNSDRPPMEAQPLVHIPHRKHKPGEMVQCTYIQIPQVAETYEHIGSKIWWAFGYEIGMNEYGVSIGNEAVWSKEPYRWGDGLLGMDLVRLALERGKTAYEAMHVIIALLEKYGQSGDCEHEGEWGKANYHNSFLLADPAGVWVLETAGRYWVAKQVKRGVYSISNIYTIESDWDEAHPDLRKHAVEKGWCRSAEELNFTRDYGDYWRRGAKHPGSMQIRRNMTLSCLRNRYGHLTPASTMEINRSHLEGTIAAPRWGAAETFWATPCMHDSARSGYHTAASMVAHLRAKMPPMLRQVYLASFSNPCVNVFQPFYLNGPRVPDNYSRGTSTYEEDSPWWRANRVKLLSDLNHTALAPAVRGVFDRTEKWIFGRREQAEARAATLIRQDRREEAARILQRYIEENTARIEKEYRMLNRTLPVMLETVGNDYLYIDYMKSWTKKAGVPLP